MLHSSLSKDRETIVLAWLLKWILGQWNEKYIIEKEKERQGFFGTVGSVFEDLPTFEPVTILGKKTASIVKIGEKTSITGPTPSHNITDPTPSQPHRKVKVKVKKKGKAAALTGAGALATSARLEKIAAKPPVGPPPPPPQSSASSASPPHLSPALSVEEGTLEMDDNPLPPPHYYTEDEDDLTDDIGGRESLSVLSILELVPALTDVPTSEKEALAASCHVTSLDPGVTLCYAVRIGFLSEPDFLSG